MSTFRNNSWRFIGVMAVAFALAGALTSCSNGKSGAIPTAMSSHTSGSSTTTSSSSPMTTAQSASALHGIVFLSGLGQGGSRVSTQVQVVDPSSKQFTQGGNFSLATQTLFPSGDETLVPGFWRTQLSSELNYIVGAYGSDYGFFTSGISGFTDVTKPLTDSLSNFSGSASAANPKIAGDNYYFEVPTSDSESSLYEIPISAFSNQNPTPTDYTRLATRPTSMDYSVNAAGAIVWHPMGQAGCSWIDGKWGYGASAQSASHFYVVSTDKSSLAAYPTQASCSAAERVANGAGTNVLPSTTRLIEYVVVSPDGTELAVDLQGQDAAGYAKDYLYTVPSGGGTPRLVTSDLTPADLLAMWL